MQDPGEAATSRGVTNPNASEADVSKGNCSIEDCEKPAKCRTWCDMHYARWRHYGDPRRVRVFAKDTPCPVAGCGRNQRVNGYCELHDRRVKKYGDPHGKRRETRPCSGPECPRQVTDKSKTGLCASHAQQLSSGRALTPLRIPEKNRPVDCQFPGCGRPNKYDGLCGAHLLQRKKGKGLQPIREINREWGPCLVADCDQTRITVGLCERHYSTRIRRWKKYGISQAIGEQLYESQGRRCGVCGEPADIDALHIDHDHTCCLPGQKGCGRCVRGLLCGSCNIGIGHFGDNADRLRQAADYLDAVLAERASVSNR